MCGRMLAFGAMDVHGNADHELCLQLGTYALFAGEVYAWFCVGEIVGR